MTDRAQRATLAMLVRRGMVSLLTRRSAPDAGLLGHPDAHVDRVVDWVLRS